MNKNAHTLSVHSESVIEALSYSTRFYLSPKVNNFHSQQVFTTELLIFRK